MRLGYLSFVLLGGCAGIVPGTALLLSNTNPLTADPGEISVALALPDGLSVLPGSVKLSLEAEREGAGEVRGIWTLEQARDPEDRVVFRLAEADRADVQSVQAQARTWEAEDPDGTRGSMSLSLAGCRTVSAANLADARASAYISLEDGGPMRPLFRNAPIAEVLSSKQVSALPPCP